MRYKGWEFGTLLYGISSYMHHACGNIKEVTDEWNDLDGGERLLAGPDGSGMVVLSFVFVVYKIDG